MRPLRANLRPLATLMLLGQLVVFGSLPAALCCAAEEPSAALHVLADRDANEPCCPGMAPGQMCPMHRAQARKTTDGPRMRCAMDSSASLPLLGLLGVLNAPEIATGESVASGAVSSHAFAALTIDITPISPPPRA